METLDLETPDLENESLFVLVLDLNEPDPENKIKYVSTKTFLGTKGKPGVRGPDGKSAYQLWKEIPSNTHKTLADFINSIKGKTGDTGADGKMGPRGLSAYEVWKTLSGNENKSIEEFFLSLIGSDGPQGHIGPRGLSAFEVWKKIPGNEYFSLENFMDFTQGRLGERGPRGIPGKPGVNGADLNIDSFEHQTKDLQPGGVYTLDLTNLTTAFSKRTVMIQSLSVRSLNVEHLFKVQIVELDSSTESIVYDSGDGVSGFYKDGKPFTIDKEKNSNTLKLKIYNQTNSSTISGLSIRIIALGK